MFKIKLFCFHIGLMLLAILIDALTKHDSLPSTILQATFVIASIGAGCTLTSFICSFESNRHDKHRKTLESMVFDAYYYKDNKLEYIRKDTVEKIETLGRLIGNHVSKQNINDRSSKIFFLFSLQSLVVELVFVTIGAICLLY